MNLKHLTDRTLLHDTKALAQQYRTVTTKILHHLREIESRKLYSDLGYSSLFWYAVQELGFSESSASRRIDAMKLLREIPELEPKLENGDLTLSNLGKASNIFKKENVTNIEFKKEVLACIENTSARTCEKTLSEIITPTEIIKPKIPEYRNLAIREDLYKKFEIIVGLLSNRHLSKDEIIEVMFNITIEALESKIYKTNSKSKNLKSNSRFIPSGLKKALYERDKVCVKCGSKFYLQIDHIKPYALGGKTELSNLRLLCHNCNQRARISSNLQRP